MDAGCLLLGASRVDMARHSTTRAAPQHPQQQPTAPEPAEVPCSFAAGSCRAMLQGVQAANGRSRERLHAPPTPPGDPCVGRGAVSPALIGLMQAHASPFRPQLRDNTSSSTVDRGANTQLSMASILYRQTISTSTTTTITTTTPATPVWPPNLEARTGHLCRQNWTSSAPCVVPGYLSYPAACVKGGRVVACPNNHLKAGGLRLSVTPKARLDPRGV